MCDIDDPLHLDEGGRQRNFRKARGDHVGLMKQNDDQLKKCFYQPRKIYDPKVVQDFRAKYDVYVKGEEQIDPLLFWDDIPLHQGLLQSIEKKKFKLPTPIQAQVFPIILSGCDLIGIAQTGSGKTIAYLFPGIIHILAQERPKRGEGPIMLILAPTRELCMQIDEQVQFYGGPCGLKSACVFGGDHNRNDQIRQLNLNPDIVVACPGRLKDFLNQRVTNLNRVSYLVFDEADRMLDMNFEEDMREIVKDIRMDRQTVYFSATWPRDVQELARDFCSEDAKYIQIGKHNITINKDIQQTILCVEQRFKVAELMKILDTMHSNDKVLIFIETKQKCEEISQELCRNQYFCMSLHGDKTQTERIKVMKEFKTGNTRLVCATDVAQRGLDVPDITVVINFDFPKSFDDYVHRIGRTGRAGKKGKSFSFLAYGRDDSNMAKKLIQLLGEAQQVIPPDLEEFANSNQVGSFNSKSKGNSYHGNKRSGGGRGYNMQYDQYNRNQQRFDGRNQPRYDDRNQARYDDRNQARYDDRQPQQRFDDRQQQRYDDRNQNFDYGGERGDNGRFRRDEYGGNGYDRGNYNQGRGGGYHQGHQNFERQNDYDRGYQNYDRRSHNYQKDGYNQERGVGFDRGNQNYEKGGEYNRGNQNYERRGEQGRGYQNYERGSGYDRGNQNFDRKSGFDKGIQNQSRGGPNRGWEDNGGSDQGLGPQRENFSGQGYKGQFQDERFERTGENFAHSHRPQNPRDERGGQGQSRSFQNDSQGSRNGQNVRYNQRDPEVQEKKQGYNPVIRDENRSDNFRERRLFNKREYQDDQNEEQPYDQRGSKGQSWQQPVNEPRGRGNNMRFSDRGLEEGQTQSQGSGGDQTMNRRFDDRGSNQDGYQMPYYQKRDPPNYDDPHNQTQRQRQGQPRDAENDEAFYNAEIKTTLQNNNLPPGQLQ